MSLPALTPGQRDRLLWLLGALGNTDAGERASAGQKAHELVRSLGLSWGELIVTTGRQSIAVATGAASAAASHGRAPRRLRSRRPRIGQADFRIIADCVFAGPAMETVAHGPCHLAGWLYDSKRLRCGRQEFRAWKAPA
jgi:hypothetical protein